MTKFFKFEKAMWIQACVNKTVEPLDLTRLGSNGLLYSQGSNSILVQICEMNVSLSRIEQYVYELENWRNIFES
jgi:hypothetical protein